MCKNEKKTVKVHKIIKIRLKAQRKATTVY